MKLPRRQTVLSLSGLAVLCAASWVIATDYTDLTKANNIGVVRIEPEDSTSLLNTPVITDASASGGKAVLFAQPSTATTFSTAYNVATGTTAGWSLELSGAAEKITVQNGRAECTAGGYAASTHYARIRRKMPELDDFAAKKDFAIRADFELPSNFYTQHESYIRFFNTDNYPAAYKSTGQLVGAVNADEWRLGFLAYGGDKLPRLMSAHQNHSEMTLWKGTSPLSTGRHVVEVKFTPSTTANGSWELWIDGVKAGGQSNVRTVPATVLPQEMAVTRIVGCIDGAADQDTKPQNVYLYSLQFRATR